MTSVLVTGASGFLGSALVNELLESGYDVRALVRHSASSSYPKSVEISSEMFVTHNARGKPRSDVKRLCISRDKRMRWMTIMSVSRTISPLMSTGRNISWTARWPEAFEQFIFASSVKVFGETTTGSVDEKEPPAPQSPYARSKWMAEQLVASYGREGALPLSRFAFP